MSFLLSYIHRDVSFEEVGRVCRVELREPIHLCTSVSEEVGDGESSHSERISLLSYTLRYVSFEEVDIIWRVTCREPMHLCTCVIEEGVDGEVARSETPSLLSFTLRCVSFAEVGRVCRVALREPMHLCTMREVCFFFESVWICAEEKKEKENTKATANFLKKQNPFSAHRDVLES